MTIRGNQYPCPGGSGATVINEEEARWPRQVCTSLREEGGSFLLIC